MKPIIPPVDRLIIEHELTDNKFLRNTNKGNNIVFVVDHHDSPNIIREIGRLRELTFRAAGGGTGKEADVDIYDVETDCPGSGVLLYSINNHLVVGGDYIGERGVSAENVGKGAFKRFIKTLNSKSTIDPFLADQILPVIAAGNTSGVFRTPFLSNHMKTNITLVNEFFDTKINIDALKEQYMVSIDN